MTKFADSRFLDWVYPMINHGIQHDAKGNIQTTRITPSQIRLLFLIHKASADDGWTEQVSYKELAVQAGLASIGTIKTDLEFLSSKGLIVKRYGEPGVPYSYKLTFHLEHEQSRQVRRGTRRLRLPNQQ